MVVRRGLVTNEVGGRALAVEHEQHRQELRGRTWQPAAATTRRDAAPARMRTPVSGTATLRAVFCRWGGSSRGDVLVPRISYLGRCSLSQTPPGHVLQKNVPLNNFFLLPPLHAVTQNEYLEGSLLIPASMEEMGAGRHSPRQRMTMKADLDDEDLVNPY